MKKITSILCALALVLSVSAAPVKSFTKGPEKQLTKQELKAQLTAGKQTVKSTDFTKQVKASAIRKAAAASTDVTITSVASKFYEEDNDVYLVMTDDVNGIDFNFDVIVAEGLEDLEPGHEYTMADAVAYYCYWMDEEWNYADFAEFTLVKTVDGEGGVKIEATVIDENGDEFNLTYSFKPTGVTIDIVTTESVTEPEYYSDGDWYFVGHNADYQFSLDIYADETSLVGNYELSDLYLDYCSIYDVATSAEITFKEASIKVVAGENDTLVITANILGSDGNQYAIQTFYAQPTAIATATVTADMTITKKQVASGWSTYDRYVFSASDEANEVMVTWTDWDEAGSYLGTFKVEDLSSLYVTPVGKDYTSAFSGTITIAEADGVVTLKGTVLCYNNTEYTLDLSYTKPGPQTIDFTITSGAVFNNGLSESTPFWQVMAQNDEFYVTLATLTDHLAGTYTEAEFYASYTYFEDLATEEKHELATANIVVTENADESIDFKGTFVDKDGNTFNVNIHYADPTPETTKVVTITEGVIYDAYAEYGLYGAYGTSEDNVYVQLGIWTDDLTAADYTEEDLDNEYIGSGISDNGKEQSIYTAAIHFAVNGADLIMTADILCYNNTLYKVTMTFPGVVPTGVENVEAESEIIKAIENGQLIIKMNGIEFNVNGARVK